MRTLFYFFLLPPVSIVVSSCGGGSSGACDAASLTSALASAHSGDTVLVGACEVTGNFTVPAGVTVSGIAGMPSAVHAASGTALTLEPGATATTVIDLAVRSDGVAGISAVGAGSVDLENLHVTATRGFAVGGESLTSFTASSVELDGPITGDADAAALPTPITPTATATHGLVLVHVAAATLTNVTTSGFAQFGALFVQSTAQWHLGDVAHDVGTGIMVDGGAVHLDSVHVLGTLAGHGTAYGIVVKDSASLTTVSVVDSMNEGFGLMQDGGTADLQDLVALSNAFAAVWLEEGATSFHLHGAATDIGGNGFAGIVGAASTNITIEDAHIHDTHVAMMGALMIGDGLHLSGAVDQVTLHNLNVENNARSEILVDAGSATHNVTTLVFDHVTVNGSGTQLGCIDQNGVFSATWDVGVTRTGATMANDATFDGHHLDAVGIVGPTMLPNADAIAMTGLGAIR